MARARVRWKATTEKDRFMSDLQINISSAVLRFLATALP
jgi:hypothetical protein